MAVDRMPASVSCSTYAAAAWTQLSMHLFRLLMFLAAVTGTQPTAASPATSDGSSVKRVLIVYEDDSTLPAVIEAARGINKGLNDPATNEYEIYTEYLDIVRFPSEQRIARLAAGLAEKYADTSFDVAMAGGFSALKFLLDNKDRIAPGVPVVFGSVTAAELNDITLPPQVRGVVSSYDVRKTIDLARALQPDAKRVVVLTGSAEFDRNWEKAARAVLNKRPTDLPTDYLSGLSLEGFKNATSKLGSDTILIILTVYQDEDGRQFAPRDSTAAITRASGAPAYGIYSSYLGTGIVGGHVETFDAMGQEMAAMAREAIEQTPASAQTVEPLGTPIVDWRALQRWGMDPARLPSGAELRYYEPSVWERHRLPILGALAVIGLQATTIAALIAQNLRRRRIEQELVVERLELAHLSRTSQLGELSGAFAHELNQPLTSILANAETGARLLEREPTDLVELKEILSDIVEDDKRAAGVIQQLRRLMVKGDTKLDHVDLNEAVAATIALARSEMIARETKWDFHSSDEELPVQGNLAQLQQIILNLLLNATEAMAHLPTAERRITVDTRHRKDGFSELAVADRGPGLSPELRLKAFQPFVTTKIEGLGLGLAICRTIAQAHGGTLTFDESYINGARVILTLPPLRDGA